MSFDNPTERISTPDFPTSTSLTTEEYERLTHDLEKMSTTTNGIEYYKYDKKDNEKPLTWIYFKNRHGEIISRIAYIVIPVNDNPKFPEVYWIDKNDNDKKDSNSELYHKFNLVGADTDYWDNFNNKIANSPLENPSVLFSETDSAKIERGGIPWLTNWNSNGSFKDSKQRGNQIIANLIDYSDKDSIATTDFDLAQPIDYTPNRPNTGKNFYKNAPTYVGLEKVPLH